MIAVKVKLLGVFRGLSGESEVTLNPKQATVRSAIETLADLLPQRAGALLIDRYLNDPRPNALILLNGKEISVLKGLETTVKNGDELAIIPVAHGG